jgi:hypothetical protein
MSGSRTCWWSRGIRTIVVEFYPSDGTVRMVITLDPMHDEEFTRLSTLGRAAAMSDATVERFGMSLNRRSSRYILVSH